jgi:hypothetical protein
MSSNPNDAAPRFQIGDVVRVTLAGPYRDKQGIITQIIGHNGDYVYRYRVRFADGNAATMFGFELKLDKLEVSHRSGSR